MRNRSKTWARSVTQWDILPDDVKGPIVRKLDEYLDVSDTTFDSFSTDQDGVKSMCNLAKATKGSMVCEILAKLPIGEYLQGSESMKEFLQNGKLPDGLSVDKIFDRWLTKALDDKRSKGGAMIGEINQMVEAKQVKSRETLMDRLAGYKAFVQKSVDEIGTTRGCLSSSFSSNYARGKGFTELFKSFLFTADPLAESRQKILDKSGLKLPEAGPDSQHDLSFLNSYDDFCTKINQYLKSPDFKSILNNKQNVTMITELFGYHGLGRNLAVYDFGEYKSQTIGNLNQVLDGFARLFEEFVKTRMEVKKLQYDEDVKFITDTNGLLKWMAERKDALESELSKKIPNRAVRARHIDEQIDKEVASVWARVSSFDLGMSEREAEKLCGMMLESIVTVVRESSAYKESASNSMYTLDEMVDMQLNVAMGQLQLSAKGNEWLVDSLRQQCKGLCESLKKLTEPNGNARNNFCGFTTKFKILQNIVANDSANVVNQTMAKK